MQRIYLALEVITISFAFAAAWFWFRSAQAFDPDLNFVDFTTVRPWLDQVARLNREATLCAAISAAAHGLAYLVVRIGL